MGLAWVPHQSLGRDKPDKRIATLAHYRWYRPISASVLLGAAPDSQIFRCVNLWRKVSAYPPALEHAHGRAPLQRIHTSIQSAPVWLLALVRNTGHFSIG